MRKRSTQRELATLDDAIVATVETENPVSLRGVYYRVVSAGAVEKTEKGYRRVGRQLLKLRRAGTVPYSYITDGLDSVAASYRRSLWDNQPAEVHVFTEKDAISGVVLPVTKRWDVPLGVLRGYASESFAHSMAEVIRSALDSRKRVYVYQLGDHDPSGTDAWRDFREKVTGFLGDQARSVVFERLAVTEQQITDMQLPTRPTKRSDTRAANWTGGDSVEVDAIPPTVLRGIVEASDYPAHR